MTEFKLRPIQKPMVEWLLEHERCALWAGMGTGKTSGVLYTLDGLIMLGEVGNAPTLVIGPARVARDTWTDELAKWANLQHLRIVPLVGSPKERLRRLRVKAEIYTISYENVPWLVEHFLDKWPFRQVIADESDRIKGFRTEKGGQRAGQLGRIARHMTKRWVNLTGTPAPNGLKDLWGQTWYLDFGKRLGFTHGAFMQRWFMKSWDGYGVVPQGHAEREIHERLHDICLTVDPRDYFDLKQPLVTQIKVHLPAGARAVYKKLEKDMYAELDSSAHVVAFNAAALTNKCLQLANGAVYTNYPQWEAVHDEKIEALKSIQAESGGTPLLVAYSFKSDVQRLMAAFPQAVRLDTDAGMAAFKLGAAPVGLAHPASMGHGIDGLQLVTNILVRFGHDWNLGTRLQMLERIGPMRQLQAALDRVVMVYDIVAEDTIDEDVIAAHASKLSVQEALLRSANRRRQC